MTEAKRKSKAEKIEGRENVKKIEKKSEAKKYVAENMKKM